MRPLAPLSLLLSFLLVTLAYASCKGRKSYVLTIRFKFSVKEKPYIPRNAVIPKLVVVTHSDNYDLFKFSSQLKDPVAQVVINRASDVLEESLDKLKDDNVVEWFKIDDDVEEDGTMRIEIRVRDSATKLSILAPLAPSPDYFVGLSNEDLCRDGRFVVKKSTFGLETFSGGLRKGEGFVQTGEEYPEKDRKPVRRPEVVEDDVFAEVEFEQGTLGVDWWKIFLGVIAALAFVVVCGIFVVSRVLKRKRREQIPLTAQEGVEW